MGSWITLAHPGIAEIMAKAGFDWLTVDMEHSVISLREAEELIRVIELSGTAPLVRLSSNDPVQIKRVMDAGAHGVIVPMVNSVPEAEAAVRAVRYPPQGNRGVGLARAQGYGASFKEYMRRLEAGVVVVVQVEHIQAVLNLERILAVDGVDACIVGPYDLSGSLGVPGRFDHPSMREAMQKILDIAKAANKPCGIHVVEPDVSELKTRVAQGYTFIAYSLDIRMLDRSCREGLKIVRSG